MEAVAGHESGESSHGFFLRFATRRLFLYVSSRSVDSCLSSLSCFDVLVNVLQRRRCHFVFLTRVHSDWLGMRLSLYWELQVEVVFPQCEMCQFASRASIIALKSVVLRTNWVGRRKCL